MVIAAIVEGLITLRFKVRGNLVLVMLLFSSTWDPIHGQIGIKIRFEFVLELDS